MGRAATDHGRSSSNGWSAYPVGPGTAEVAALAAARLGGECMALGEQFQRHRRRTPGCWGTQQGSGDPLGTCGGREDTGPRGRSCRGAPPSCAGQCPPCPQHPGSHGLGSAGVTAGADSRAEELATASVIVPPLCHIVPGMERGHQGAWVSQDKQLPGSHAPGRGRGSSLGAHT